MGGGQQHGEWRVQNVVMTDVSLQCKEQKTVTKDGQETLLAAKGRHDPCVLPRAVPMVEAMVALVLCDRLLYNQAQCKTLSSP